MRAPHLTPPIQLHLPGGIVADYVSESDPPKYAVGGELLAVDVVIPEDLAQAGWFWFGTTLYWADPGDPNHCVGVSPGTYPPPGWPSDRPDCFTVAREMNPVPVAQMAAAPAKPAPAPKRTKRPPAPVQLVQAAMEL